MLQRLSGLPARVVIDTNVLLNACFLSDSSARRAITQLRELGYTTVIDEAIESEVEKILRRMKIKLSLGYDPLAALHTYMSHASILTLPRAGMLRLEGVNRADHHVYSAARHYESWILTGDIKFAAELHGKNVHARTPWDVAMHAASSSGEPTPLKYVFRVIGVSAERGSIFARVVPGEWGQTAKEFTVCDIENVGRLYYDSKDGSWVFKTTLDASVKAPCALTADEHWTVSASYEYDQLKKKTSATLRAHSSNGSTCHSSVELGGGFGAATPGKISFGHSVTLSDHWNGHVRKVLVSPTTISKATWAALRKIPDSDPDPTAGNVLESALKRVKTQGGFLIVPSEEQLNQTWI